MTHRSRSAFLFLFCALALSPSISVAQGAAPPQPGPPVPSMPAAENKVPELDLLTFYKDNYFLTGFTSGQEVKFQFSAKFDVWPNRGPHAVYFAFSQKSLWNLYQPSQPFLENNYAPELFYTYFHAPNSYEPAAGCSFFLERAGVIHESNGEGGAGSRGWNRVYGESRFACYNAARNYADVTLELWAPPFGVADNPHIARYEGYGELSFSVGNDQGQGWLGDWDITAHGRKGTLLRAASIEIDARWRPRYGDFWRFTPYLYGQAFSGYGETLLTYDRSLTAFRVGIGFTDRSTRTE
jgi:phospholipase A1